MSREAAIALNRFGLGARPGELAQITDPKGWLRAQLTRGPASPPAFAGLRSSAQAVQRQIAYQAARREAGQDQARLRQLNRAFDTETARLAALEITAWGTAGLTAEASFLERLYHFWTNHFTVPLGKQLPNLLIGTCDREAVRPRLLGRFADLLVAVTTHPGMLTYLDNHVSIGPNSVVGRRGQRGLNENLAREILELHTLGVDGGYTQADVLELAKAITGWAVGGIAEVRGAPGSFAFLPERHEPGTRTVLGKSYPATNGPEQGLAILRDLAVHPATARHLATKLARHFIEDEPSAAVVEALASEFTRTRGDLRAVMLRLIDLPQAWEGALNKLKAPQTFILSALRGVGVTAIEAAQLTPALETMGQRVFGATSPAGWPDRNESWAGSDSVFKRIQYAQSLGTASGDKIDPTKLLGQALGPLAGETSTLTVSRAASRPQGVTLALSSPEFMRR